ncbi:MAG: 2-oxoacid:ferredoxin oxidoreductase subunit beta, partial [Deltaproteobacteria bacterium]|nr:2-oxoacid:ferredoxin oxidoreductase subunit beta [Deltaproteobacteria bacterium]
YGRRNKEKPLDTLKLYQEKGIILNDAHPSEADIDFEKGIILGKFIDTDRPTFSEMYDRTCRPE